MPDERIVCTAKVHWIVFMPGAFILAWAFLLALGAGAANNPAFMIFFWVGLYFLVRGYAVRKATELAITTKRVFAKHGLVKRKTIELNLSKVESFVVTQGIFGRLFGYGTITVNGTGGVRTPIRKIEKPMEFRRAAVAAVDVAQSAGTLQTRAA
jgi:uncharacterized membrane protein YdbT with pleckstrin-like domain